MPAHHTCLFLRCTSHSPVEARASVTMADLIAGGSSGHAATISLRLEPGLLISLLSSLSELAISMVLGLSLVGTSTGSFEGAETSVRSCCNFLIYGRLDLIFPKLNLIILKN